MSQQRGRIKLHTLTGAATVRVGDHIKRSSKNE